MDAKEVWDRVEYALEDPGAGHARRPFGPSASASWETTPR
jgi:hypothetical protein